MSNVRERLNEAMRDKRPLSERLVWMCLVAHAQYEPVFPLTIASIMQEMHLGRSSVLKAVKVLEADGVITRELRRRQPTLYSLHDAGART